MANELRVSSRAEWRSWLQKNHEIEKEAWLIYFKKHACEPSVPYDDSVEEALCFGWVDSIIKRIDDEKFARKFTPRTRKSTWSEANKKRVEKLIKEGKMTEAGLVAIREAKESGKWLEKPVSASYKRELVLPSYFKKALATNRKASHNFNKMAESYKKNIVGWVDSAKKEETRARRLKEVMGLLERNQRLGMK
jgi:uncharacterized protein YdeI (YjbR/CyaY-like superfamily)